MKTDDLINLLATGQGVHAPPPRAEMVVMVPLGVMVSMMLMMGLLGVRPDLAAVAWQPPFLLKITFVAALAAAGRFAFARLGSPGASVSMLPALFAAPMLLMWFIAAQVLMAAEPAQRSLLFFGATWRTCPFLIAALSAPILVAVFRAMRSRAPTRLRLAGAAAGFTAGALAAAVYCLHCPEIAPPFVAFWYLLGILIPTGVGALIGPRVLAW